MTEAETPTRGLAIAVAAVAALQLALHGALLARGVELAVSALTIDDTYYYLGAAWNLKRLGFPSFDGIHPTNGVQFLWFWVVAGLAWLAPTKTALLQAALAVAALANAACHLVIWRFARFLGAPRLALWMSGLWLLQSLGSVTYSRGLENSLHALLFWCLAWQATVFLTEVRAGRGPGRLGVLTLLLILNTWSRIDAALLSALLYGVFVVVAWRASKPGRDRRRLGLAIAASAAAAAAAGGLQLLGFRWMGGSWLPVSALVKGGLAVESWGAVALRVVRLALPALVPAGTALVLLALYVAIVLRPDRRSGTASEPLSAWNRLWLVLLAGVTLHLVLVRGGAYWYLAPSHVFWNVTLALLADRSTGALVRASAGSRGAGASRPRARLRLAAGALFLVGSVATTGLLVARRAQTEPNFYALRARVGRWISENLPPETILASWNAGQLGYFSDQPVINLDGLANSASYYREVLDGPTPLADYLDAEGVDYLVDRSDDTRIRALQEDGAMNRYPVVRRFELQEDEPGVLLWRVKQRPARRDRR